MITFSPMPGFITTIISLLALSPSGSCGMNQKTFEILHRLDPSNEFVPRGHLVIHYSAQDASPVFIQKKLTTQEFLTLRETAEKGQDYTLRVMTYPGGVLCGDEQLKAEVLITAGLSDVFVFKIGVTGEIGFITYSSDRNVKSAAISVREFNTSAHFVFEQDHKKVTPTEEIHQTLLTLTSVGFATVTLVLVLLIGFFLLACVYIKYGQWKAPVVSPSQTGTKNEETLCTGDEINHGDNSRNVANQDSQADMNRSCGGEAEIELQNKSDSKSSACIVQNDPEEQDQPVSGTSCRIPKQNVEPPPPRFSLDQASEGEWGNEAEAHSDLFPQEYRPVSTTGSYQCPKCHYVKHNTPSVIETKSTISSASESLRSRGSNVVYDSDNSSSQAGAGETMAQTNESEENSANQLDLPSGSLRSSDSNDSPSPPPLEVPFPSPSGSN